MGKRFTDTKKFDDKWYRGLNLLQKVLWEYLLCECNHAGILEKFDTELISFKMGVKVTLADVKSLGERIIFISDEILYIPNFIKFQYEELNPSNRVHRSVLKILKKYNLQAPCKVLTSPLEGAKNKNKDKDKDKEINLLSSKNEEEKEIKKEKEEEKSKPSVSLEEKPVTTPIRKNERINPDLMYDADVNKVFELYKQNCKNLISLGFEPRDLKLRQKVKEFLTLVKDDFQYVEELFKKADKLRVIVSRKIDFEMAITNHRRISSGFYKEENQVGKKESMAEYLKKWRERQDE